MRGKDRRDRQVGDLQELSEQLVSVDDGIQSSAGSAQELASTAVESSDCTANLVALVERFQLTED